jgi:predicted component of type VI protein secretion system
MYNYDIGGQERKSEVTEGIADIPQNRTLVIEKLTDDPPLSPQIIPDLKNINDVFSFFKPAKEVEFETMEGSSKTEQLHFESLGDFGKQGVIKQSTYMNELSHQCDDLQKFARQLKSNKILKTLLENKEAKASYMACVQALLDELDQTA